MRWTIRHMKKARFSRRPVWQRQETLLPNPEDINNVQVYVMIWVAKQQLGFSDQSALTFLFSLTFGIWKYVRNNVDFSRKCHLEAIWTRKRHLSATQSQQAYNNGHTGCTKMATPKPFARGVPKWQVPVPSYFSPGLWFVDFAHGSRHQNGDRMRYII